MEPKDLQILGSIVDDTFGDNYGGLDTFRIRGKLVNEKTMQVTCMVVVNLLNRSDMRKEADKAKDQLNSACNSYMKEVKKNFKEAAGRALKTKELGISDSVELMTMSSYTPVGTALVRCIYTFEVS